MLCRHLLFAGTVRRAGAFYIPGAAIHPLMELFAVSSSSHPRRLLIVCPSWLGDVVMATPALRLLRRSLPGAFIGALVRPGLDQLLAGSDFFDEMHVDRAHGVMGPKLVAAKLRPRRYDAALLLTNSFSTALITRLAFIPRRVGYQRDGRGVLLTDKLQAPRRARPHRGWAPISAMDYYLRAARVLLHGDELPLADAAERLMLELAVTPAQDEAASELLNNAGLPVVAPQANSESSAALSAARFAILNPGGNNPAKRWPAERFAEIGAHLLRRHALHVLVNGSPNEQEVTRRVVDEINRLVPAEERFGLIAADLSTLGVTIGSLKAIVKRAALMVSNDTGPRHIAAAFGVPTVALFGPTDPRWTTLPDSSAAPGTRERVLVADPTLPPDEVADDHPERCRIEGIATETVVRAVDDVIASPSGVTQ